MIRRILLVIAAPVLVAMGLIWALAPQLPVLVREGFPGPVWPTSGTFSAVGGPVAAPSAPVAEAPPDAALSRFTKAQGRALIALRDGEVIAEHYATDITPSTRLNSYSMVKSLVGLLILRAYADGLIPSLDTRLPEILGPDAPDISIRDSLTMTSGLHLTGEPPKDDVTAPLDDRDFSPFSPVARLHAFGIEALLPRLRIDEGSVGRFHYQSANTALLGLVLETVHGQPLEHILSRIIWAPAGATPAQWRQTPQTGRVSAYCCLYATARDWARVAAFILSNGTETAPLLPDAVWREWLLPDLPPDQRRAGVYGLHIRHDVLDRPGAALQGPFAYMMGHGGQVAYLMPQHQIAVIRFGDGPQLLHSTLYDLFPEG